MAPKYIFQRGKLAVSFREGAPPKTNMEPENTRKEKEKHLHKPPILLGSKC